MFVPVGEALLEINPWICLFASSSLMVVGFVATILFVPETWRSVETEQGQCVAGQAQSKWHLLDLWKSFLANLITLMKWARDNGRVVLIITAFFTCTLGREASGPLFLQYTSKRLGWSLGKVSFQRSKEYLQASFGNSTDICLTTGILPRRLRRRCKSHRPRIRNPRPINLPTPATPPPRNLKRQTHCPTQRHISHLRINPHLSSRLSAHSSNRPRRRFPGPCVPRAGSKCCHEYGPAGASRFVVYGHCDIYVCGDAYWGTDFGGDI